MDVGSHPSAQGMSFNQGEQYLFHWRHPFGGIFLTTSAGSDFVRVRTNYPTADWDADGKPYSHYFTDNKYSQVLPEVGTNSHWIVFISQGRGAGQYREVSAAEDYSYYAKKLTVDRPWRVIPDTTSRINLMPAYRDITLYHNSIDGGNGDPTHKIHGPTFFLESFGNYVVKNTILNVTAGVVFASRYRSPSAWNYAIGNTIEDIVDGYTGDTAVMPCALNDQFYQTTLEWPLLSDPANYAIGRVWYSVGNVFRGNICQDVVNGVTLLARYTSSTPPAEVDHTDAGMILNIVENNTIVAEHGVTLSSPVNGAYIWNNSITASESDYCEVASDEETHLKNVVIDGIEIDDQIIHCVDDEE